MFSRRRDAIVKDHNALAEDVEDLKNDQRILRERETEDGGRIERIGEVLLK
jgi:hypothetical protein